MYEKKINQTKYILQNGNAAPRKVCLYIHEYVLKKVTVSSPNEAFLLSIVSWAGFPSSSSASTELELVL